MSLSMIHDIDVIDTNTRASSSSYSPTDKETTEDNLIWSKMSNVPPDIRAIVLQDDKYKTYRHVVAYCGGGDEHRKHLLELARIIATEEVQKREEEVQKRVIRNQKEVFLNDCLNEIHATPTLMAMMASERFKNVYLDTIKVDGNEVCCLIHRHL